ncbi:G protein regulated inducer of neurite outgrowth 1 [Stigmatopora nigra]
MGSLKDETKGFRKDSNADSVLEGPLTNTNQDSMGRGGSRIEQPCDNDDEHSFAENTKEANSDKGPDGSSQSGLQNDCDSEQNVLLTQQSESDKDTAMDETIQNTDNTAEDTVSFPLSSSADPFGPNSPAPFGQQHMRTQVSLEVVQCQSAATSPMTPPEGAHSFIFPSSFGIFGANVGMQMGEQVEFCSVATSPMTPKTPSTSAFPALAERDGNRSQTNPPARVESNSKGEDHNRQNKQQRMGSMEQDITILVTHYDNDEVKQKEQEVIKIDEDKENDNKVETQREIEDVLHEKKDVSRPPIPESPAPDGYHNIRTQVSLEVVQCHSVATSPMTPPDGDQAFRFPSCGEGTEAETTMSQQVQYRSIATAPMTPRTPVATTFPEIGKEAITEENMEEKESDNKKEEEEEEEESEGNEEEEGEDDEEKIEEVVQEVSWDEKGMTWEVYGAVVEVAVLGSAIQKHLEKQVKKQKSPPSLPPPPPLNPSATPLVYDAMQGGSGRCRAGKRRERDDKVGHNRRNPFRLLMENMQQPHCCAKAHTTE